MNTAQASGDVGFQWERVRELPGPALQDTHMDTQSQQRCAANSYPTLLASKISMPIPYVKCRCYTGSSGTLKQLS